MKLFENVFCTMDLSEELVTFEMVVDYADGAAGILAPNVTDLCVETQQFTEFEEAIFIRQPNFLELKFKMRAIFSGTATEKIPTYCLWRLSQEAKELRYELHVRAVTKEIILTPLQKLFNIYAVK